LDVAGCNTRGYGSLVLPDAMGLSRLARYCVVTMTQKIAIYVVVSTIVVALGWDTLLICLGQDIHQSSFCQACRNLNKSTDGLLALGAVALWIHIFLLQILPSWWRHG